MEPEYFTALNEAAAHKYVGKTMEFKEDANRSRDLDRRIVCLHIRQEYEVKE